MKGRSYFGNNSDLSAALLFALLVASWQLIDSVPMQPTPTSTKAVTGPFFPYHRCSDYSNASLPYHLLLPVEKARGLYCSMVTYLGSVPHPTACYTQLTQMAHQITIAVSECTNNMS